MKKIFLLLFITAHSLFAQKILIPMDNTQTDHLKAYGIVFSALEQNRPVEWLLNYRGGSFMMDFSAFSIKQMKLRGVSYEEINQQTASSIGAQINEEGNNTAVMKLEKSPKIVVYVPPTNLPWDDAVTLALTYAEIPFTKIWDEEVLRGDLSKYDWLHVHHEDFTGQFGKFYGNFRNESWYIKQVRDGEKMALKLGYRKVSDEKKAVAQTIHSFVTQGGFMFAMCSAPDSYDISIAAEKVDIVPKELDGDDITPNAQEKLNFTNTFAFQNFILDFNPYNYSKSNIDLNPYTTGVPTTEETDYFSLFEFSAKYDPVPTMLTQNHKRIIKSFFGQTTSFRKSLIKENVVIMGEKKETEEVKYIHGVYGKGQFCFYSGHDPEDYQHVIGEEPTNLSLYKNSPGYRLILNNVLFPAAEKKKQKT